MGMEVSGEDATADGGMTEDQLLSLAKAWMERALSSAHEGDGANYRKMLLDLREVKIEDSASLSALQLRLRALSQCVYFINDRYHQALLDHVLGMSIWIYGGEVADSLLEFVTNLATTSGGCVGQCLDMLVRNFLPPSCGLPSFLDTYSKFGLMGGWLSLEKIRAQQSEHMSKKDDVLNRLHTAIFQISSLVPTTTSRLQPIVYRRMPHRSSAKEWNILYLENMLRLESSGSQYTVGQMLPAVIDHLIQIDVEIRWEYILEGDSSKVYMFQMDLEEETEERMADEKGDGDPAGPGLEANIQHGLVGRPSKNHLATLDDMADKMDLMMDLTLEHLQTCARRGQADQVYDMLVKSFQSTILHTYKSKFTQFLVFYFCSLAPNTCGRRFASRLCDLFISKALPLNTRMSAAAYLASYLARSKTLPVDVVSTSLKMLVKWCNAYGGEDGVTCLSPALDTGLHDLYFSACQAVMYTLCFRFKVLADSSEGKHFLRGLELQKFVEHRLNPLKVCSSSVVEEFLKKASALQLLEKKHWPGTGKQLDKSLRGGFAGGFNRDMFFPFDPYLLRHSDRFIRPNFIYWSMVEPVDVNEVSDFEDDYDSSDESEPSSEARSLSSEHAESPSSQRKGLYFDEHLYSKEGNVDSFANSFDSMAISPPKVQKMPAKLPAKLQVYFGETMHGI